MAAESSDEENEFEGDDDEPEDMQVDEDDNEDNDDGDDDDDDDEEEDVPLSSLANDDDGGDDDKKSGEKRRRSAVVSYAEDDDDDADDDDDDDDVPLSSLAAPSKKKKSNSSSTSTNGTTPKTKKKATTKKKKETTTKTTSTTSSSTTGVSSGSGSEDYMSASAALYGTKCQKGLLIQRLLCRWWYAIEWPAKSSLPPTPPKHYDPLDGFPGVYVCTEGEEVGQIKDFRDPLTCPNFKNMARKSSEELQQLLIQALTEQRKQLIDAEGTDTEIQKDLDKLLSWAKKVKASAADKEAIKVLKAAKFSLD